MSSLLISFRSLAKNNNGFFKSTKQASFLLSQCDDGVFKTTSNASFSFGIDGNVNNSYDVIITCDNSGVVSIKHVGHKSQKETIAFNRPNISKEDSDALVSAKNDRKATFARFDKLQACHISQLLRCGKLVGKTMEQRLRIYEIIIKIEEKQAALHIKRNAA